ncbi:putative ATP-dependent RNA helicase TDRD12 [Oppia nitens]|uniref:putative ATP-dependent RNA helicase TDRD12 n=1 Tax=Oppia nitens TaxID=1686743 RepID=UPI0023DB79D5|nr:putative ATP-dependent RNA helicase TDRD12 [Oppia nitens]
MTSTSSTTHQMNGNNEEDNDLSDDEIRYLSSTRVATHFTGEDLYERAGIERRNVMKGLDNISVPLNEYNEGMVDMMIDRDHTQDSNLNNVLTDYQIKSMVDSYFDSRDDNQSNKSWDKQSDEDNDVEVIEEPQNWTRSVFLPPKQDIEYLETDFQYYNIDLNESEDTYLNYSDFSAPKPYDSYEKAFGFQKCFLSRLKKIQCKDVRLELHLWPSIMKGNSICCVSGPKSGKTNTYLIPLMNWFDCQEDTEIQIEEAGIGAIVICSNTRQTYDIARQAKQWRDPDIKESLKVISMNSSNATKLYASLANGCDILVTTPEPLLKAIEAQIFGCSTTKCLIIDEADVCLNIHLTTIRKIIIEFAKQRYCKNDENDKKDVLAFQTLVFSEKWTKGVEWFAKEIQTHPVICFGSFYELSILFKVKCNLVIINEEQRDEALQMILKNAINQKLMRIAVIFRTIDELKFVKRLLSKSFKTRTVTHLTPHYEVEEIRRVWKSGEYILLINDKAIKQVAGFKKCQFIVHYKLPDHFDKTFGDRFQLMKDYFKKYKTVFNVQNTDKLNQYIIFSPEDKQHMAHMISYMKRMRIKIPNELTNICDLPVCNVFSSLNDCPFESYDCPYMHSFATKTVSVPTLPSNGQIKITITYVLNANEFYFRIIEFRNECHKSGRWQKYDVIYEQLSRDLISLKDMSYNTILFNELSDVEIYGISIRGQVFRVCLTKILGKDDLNFYEDYNSNDYSQKVELFCIDFGHKLRSNSRQLFKLPAHLKTHPGLAFKGYLCGIKPIDNEIQWDFRSTQKLYDLVDNFRISQITAWILKQNNGVFWLNRMNVQKKMKNTKVKLETNIIDYMTKHKFAENNNKKLLNVNFDYNKITNIWYNFLLNSVAFNSCLVDETTYVVVSDWVSTEEFYVIIENRVNRLQQLEDKWMSCLNTLRPLTEIIEQQICFYKFYDKVYNESTLNRAKILVINGDKVDIFLVDHGQTVRNVSKDNLYLIRDIYLKELPFQAIKVSLFGVKQVSKEITYDQICELTRNDDDQYLMAIAQKNILEESSHMIRLFLADNKKETEFTALSKLLVDLGLCEFIDNENNNLLNLVIERDSNDSDEESNDFIDRIDNELTDNMIQDWVLKYMDLNENEDIDCTLKNKIINGSVKESRISKKMRQLRDLKRNQNGVDSDESDEENSMTTNKYLPSIDLSNYKPYDKSQPILAYDPDDDLDNDSLHSDEDNAIDEYDLS